MREHSDYEALLMKAVDGVIGADEQRLLDAHIEGCAGCRGELADFLAVKETTDAMTQRILQDARLEPPRERGAVKAIVAYSFGLMLAGALLLLGFGAWVMLTDVEMPLVVKVGAGLGAIGALGLVAVALRTRLRGRDPYEEIDQ